jgi:DNA replication protein DnaC
MHELTKSLANELKFFGIHHNLEARAAEAVSGSLHPLEFLGLLLQDEKLARQDRLSRSLTKRAKFRHQADIEDWDTSYDRGLTKPKLKELALLSFQKNKQNLILLGKTGEGKTQLAICVGRKACQDGQSVAFLPVNLMFEEVLAARAAGKFLGYLQRLNQTQVLILDDFGLRGYTHEEANVLVELLEGRVKKGPIIVTSQVDPKGWFKLFEDPVIAEAIVDRMINPAQRLQLKGGSYRERLNLLPNGKALAEKPMLI